MGSSLMWAARYSTSLLHIDESWTCKVYMLFFNMRYNHVLLCVSCGACQTVVVLTDPCVSMKFTLFIYNFIAQ